MRDFPGSPMVGTSPSSAGSTGSIPARGAKIPHALRPKNQNMKQKNIVTNSIKTLKMVHIKKNLWKKSTRNERKRLAFLVVVIVGWYYCCCLPEIEGFKTFLLILPLQWWKGPLIKEKMRNKCFILKDSKQVQFSACQQDGRLNRKSYKTKIFFQFLKKK